MAFGLSKLSDLFKSSTDEPAAQGVIGVDVGSSSIKIVQLHDNKGVVTLDTYGELQLGPYDNTDIGRAVRLPVNKLVQAFIDILREASASARQVSVAISYNASFSTIITVTESDPERITAMIPVEARKYVPVPLSDITIDWFPVVSNPEQKKTQILLAAIHNESLTRYDAMIEGANLARIAQEMELFSSIRTVINEEDKVVAIVDVGAGSTKLSIIHNGTIRKLHSVLMNGTDLTTAISRIKKIDFKTAEEQKRAKGLAIVVDEPELEKAFTTSLERGLREIHAVIQKHEVSEGVTIEKVILSGGGSLLKGFLPYVQDTLSHPVVLADPFSKVAYPAFLEDTLREAGPSFAVAVGAALRGLTLGKQ